MRSKALILGLLMSWQAAALPAPRIAVIANQHGEYHGLEKKQVADIYLGRVTNLANGNIPLPLDQPGNSPLRRRFYELLTGNPVQQINAYWARILFSGRATPPRIVSDSSAILRAVRDNRDTIGYVQENEVDSSVTVLFYLDEQTP